MASPATSASGNGVGKRKGGNIDYSFCERLIRRVEFGCLEGGKDEHVHDVGTDCDTPSGSSVLRLLDWPNGKKTRPIALNILQRNAFRNH
jgi:hypothetical protein